MNNTTLEKKIEKRVTIPWLNTAVVRRVSSRAVHLGHYVTKSPRKHTLCNDTVAALHSRCHRSTAEPTRWLALRNSGESRTSGDVRDKYHGKIQKAIPDTCAN